jgi:hypothetical protein
MRLFSSSKCAHCRTPLSVREKTVNILKSPTAPRCRACKIKASKALRRFAHEFRLACEDAVITSDEWQSLWVKLQPSGVSRDEALAYIRTDALRFLNRLIDLTFEDGLVTLEEEVYFRRMISTLEISPRDTADLRAKWEEVKRSRASHKSNV